MEPAASGGAEVAAAVGAVATTDMKAGLGAAACATDRKAGLAVGTAGLAAAGSSSGLMVHQELHRKSSFLCADCYWNADQ